MHGPVVETVLLLLLAMFFGIQQRQRPQLYFRIWTVGWVLVSLSLMIWDVDLSRSSARVLLAQEIVRYDLILLAGLAFSVALVVAREQLGRTVALLALLAAPALVGIDLQMGSVLPKQILQPLLLLLVVGAQVGGIVWATGAIPLAWRTRKPIILLFCAGATAWIATAIVRGRSMDVGDVIVAQIFLCAAVHSLGTFRRTLAGVMGGIGFAAWGVFYVLPDINLHSGFALHLLYIFWNVPKYLVGFSMVLRVMEVDSEEKARLLRQVRILYNDFKELYDSHPQPVWIEDALGERFLSTNRAAQEAYGWSAQEFLALRRPQLESAAQHEPSELESVIPGLPDGSLVQHRFKDGRLAWINVVERPIVFRGYDAKLVLARDVTERLRVGRELSYKAHHDALTGLPNRLLLQERLPQCLAVCDGDGLRAAVLAIDLDHFKRVNDTHGHMVGDACLQAVAARLQSRVRQVDIIARTGGEEFVAVVGRLQSLEDARKVALSLLELFGESVHLEECELTLTLSIGVAVYPDDGRTPIELRQRADKALYAAKHRGRACVVLAQEMDAVAPV